MHPVLAQRQRSMIAARGPDPDGVVASVRPVATLLHDVVLASERVAATRSRNEKLSHLAACLRALEPEEIALGVAFLTGETRQGRIGLGWAAAASAGAAGAATAPTLTLGEVDATFEAIAGRRGAGSAGDRHRALGTLFARATPVEQRFLHRLVIGELRQGALEGLLVEAIARAAGIPASDVRRAVMLAGETATVARAALTEGAAGLARFRLEVLRPVQPMLAQTTEDAADALVRLGSAVAEHKIDGARVQVHRDGDEVRVFTRQLNDVTAAVPEIVGIARALPVRRIVLDGEAIVLDPSGMPTPFQTTMRRFGRRLDVDRLAADLPLAAYFFDCLHVDGEDLVDRPTEARWSALAGVVPASRQIARRLVADAAAAEAVLGEALSAGHEGIMLKAAGAAYEAGRRGTSWLKLKPAHTLDLVVLAAEWGSGRRHGWLSNLHLGARDPALGGFVMLGKTFKGMTDDMLRWQTEHLTALEIGRDAHVVHVRPELVVEVAFDGVQASPHYPGGMALRFARVKRHRPDKSAGEADTIDAVRAIFARGG
jgi:DNA ligase-1